LPHLQIYYVVKYWTVLETIDKSRNSCSNNIPLTGSGSGYVSHVSYEIYNLHILENIGVLYSLENKQLNFASMMFHGLFHSLYFTFLTK